MGVTVRVIRKKLGGCVLLTPPDWYWQKVKPQHESKPPRERKGGKS